ncbi:MAG TPA: PEP-CTERM sorting domain-containing protein [Bryobacteraceae bacterium]|nr:PEP-CTERM sorting domain-containing protein [Bryobacteraceae bacterium]
MKLTTSFLFLASLCNAGPVYYLATDQSGAQTQIDVNHTSTWLLTPNVAFDFGGGLFTMKDGSGTSANVTLSFYQGVNASGTLLGTVPLTVTSFCAQVSNCGQFAFHQFFFATPIPMAAGTTYFAALTSPALDTQSTAYFIKNNTYFISDQAGTAIQPSPVSFTAVPEPASLALVGFGSLLLWGVRSRRSRSAASGA